ncbi:putative phosphinothricin acetyltransferase YwnH [compost metagenome]
MTSSDRDALVAFIATLPPHDLLFLSRDITHPKVVDAWMHSLDSGEIESLVARDGGLIIGVTAIIIDRLGWSPHVGELRILMSPAGRGKGGGRVLMQECFAQALDLGLKKLVAQMTTDQRAAINVFEGMGFRAEALLAKHVADRQGRLHDLVVLSHDVQVVAARHELYRMSDACQEGGT